MKKISILAAGLLAGVAVASAAKADTFKLNYEAPGAQNTTTVFSVSGVETFDSQPVGTGTSFTTDFGTGGVISGTYSGGQINSADQYGGAGGVGNYVAAFGSDPYTLTLTNNAVLNPKGINYFGYWLSALDSGNQVEFLKNGVVVGQLSPSDVLGSIGSNSAYFGNPNANFLGQNSGQPYAFINFYDTDGTFDQVVFSENPAVGGYESDNQTVGFYTQEGGVPEPSTWAMLLLGFGGLGFMGLRGSRKIALAA